MRSSKSRSRNKSRSISRPTGGNIINRVFDSSGPDGKVRGTPQQIIEKYNQLHRDAQLSGDRVAAENFSQHAEHYTRLLAEAMREVDRAREEQEQFNRDRQADRDRERADRLRQQEDDSNGAGDQPDVQETPRPPRENREPRDNREPREQREPQPNREPREPHQSREQREPRENRAPRAAPADVIEPAEPTDNGLVETPEAQPKARRPRARKPRPEGAADNAGNSTTGGPDPVEAAE